MIGPLRVCYFERNIITLCVDLNQVYDKKVSKIWHKSQVKTLLIRQHGIYYYPKEYKDYGLGIIYPAIEDIAQAIARRDKAKIAPMRAYALNRLGLSTQIPMNIVFLTNGAPRRIRISNGHGILFKHSSSGKNFAYKSELMMLIVTAMRTIGKENITEEICHQLWQYRKPHENQ